MIGYITKFKIAGTLEADVYLGTKYQALGLMGFLQEMFEQFPRASFRNFINTEIRQSQ